MRVDAKCCGLTVVVMLLAAGCSAHSGAGSAAPLVSAPAHASAAQRVSLDSPAIAQAALSSQRPATEAGRALEPGVEVRLPDGTVGVKVAAQYFHTIVACRQADGSFSTHCPEPQESRP
jgi:hypothetical protein